MLLGRFLDMGPWAVNLVIFCGAAVGIIFFPVCTSVMLKLCISEISILVGLVCWNISIHSKAFADYYSRATAYSRVHMDKDPRTG